MSRTKSAFLCVLLVTLVFIPVKYDIVFAKEKVGVTTEVVEEKNNLFNEIIIWETGSLEESSIKISNNLSENGILSNTGISSNKNFMIFVVLALGIELSILKLPQKKEEI